MIGASPWKETLRFADLARGPVRRSLEADASTRKAVARHLDVEAVKTLTAEVTVRPWLDGAELEGRFRADVTQLCSLSAELFDEAVAGEFVIRVLPAGSPNAPQEDEGEEIDLDPDADDPPDVVEGETIDLGGYVVEHLSLELDPFPRKPGATFEQPESTEPASPFAVLRSLKKDNAPE
ncbi:MAG TPA: YceD family protein [Caulobacter sp.]|nr:YceD family protein [Caulobacter sp.]